MFDERRIDLQDIGLGVVPKSQRQRCDNKMETVRIGNKAKVASVPNTLGPAKTFEQLMTSAKKSGIGTDLVVQTAFGDSGHTTFFISNEQEYARHAKELAAESEVKS
jgi:biotin carboxylase